MFCENCGKQIEDSAKFCEHCGAKVDAVPSYPSEPASGAAYSAPEASYTQPGTSYSQPGAAYTRPGATHERSNGFTVSAKPEMRILGIPVRGKGMWIALGVIAVVVIAVVAIAKLGGAKETVEDEPARSFSVEENTPEPTPTPTPEPTPEPGPDMAEIAGIYKLAQMSTEEDGDLAENIEMMTAAGLTITMELNRDGTGVMDIYGEDSEEFTWDADGITVDGETGSLAYENDTVTIAQDGGVMVFERTTYAELRALEEAGAAFWDEFEAAFADQPDAAALAGDYYATECLQYGDDVGVDGEYLHLNGDGTGYFHLIFSDFDIEWRLDGESFYFIDETDDEFNGTYRDGVIEGEYFSGYYYVLERDSASTPAENTGGAPAHDPDTFSTSDAPSLADFQWLTYDVVHGARPDGLEWLEDFEAVRGGWKCYLIDDPDGEYDSMMERFLNVFIGGTPDSADVTFDWFYVYDGSADQGFDDDTPTTVFSGSWENAVISATGSGSVTLTDFWYADGHEYGMGVYIWPDGVPALVALVRP